MSRFFLIGGNTKNFRRAWLFIIVIVILFGTLPLGHASSENSVYLHFTDAWRIDVQTTEIGTDELTFDKVYEFGLYNDKDDSGKQIEEVRLIFEPHESLFVVDTYTYSSRSTAEQVDTHSIIYRNVLEDGGGTLGFRTMEGKKMVPPFVIKREVDNLYFESKGTQTVTISFIPQESSFHSVWIEIDPQSTNEANISILSISTANFSRLSERGTVAFQIINPVRGREYVAKVKLQVIPTMSAVSYIPCVGVNVREADNGKNMTSDTVSVATTFGTGKVESVEDLKFSVHEGQCITVNFGLISSSSKLIIKDGSVTVPTPTSRFTPTVTTPTPTPIPKEYLQWHFIVPPIVVLTFIGLFAFLKFRGRAGKEKRESSETAGTELIESTAKLETSVAHLQKEQKEEPKKIGGYKVFICYSSEDKRVADAMCATLESKGIPCWIAPRDVLPGINYQEALIKAIDKSQIMTLIFSSHSNTSPHVIRELSRAVSKGVIIIPFRIEDVPLSVSMEYLVALPHWLDALTPPLEQHLEKLAKTIQVLLKEINNEDNRKSE